MTENQRKRVYRKVDIVEMINKKNNIKNIKKAINILGIILEDNVSSLKSREYAKINEVREFLFKFGEL